MKTPDTWRQFADEHAHSLALSQALQASIQDLLARQNRMVLALSGGQSPRAMMALLSQANLDWSRVTVQWVDERLLTRHHPDSNSELIEQALLQHEAAQAQWCNVLPLLDGEARVLDTAEQQKVLQAALAAYQTPDIVVLGMGTDGHTASLFANAPQFAAAMDAHQTQPLLIVEPPSAPYARISMTLAAILQAKMLYIGAYGAEKQVLLQQIMLTEDRQWPIAWVLDTAEQQKVLQAALAAYQTPDIVVLGMGTDGHTASLFANAPQFAAAMDAHQTQPLLIVEPPSAPYARISMTLAAILQAKMLYIGAYGAEKQVLLQQIMLTEDRQWPIAWVLQGAQDVPVHVFA